MEFQDNSRIQKSKTFFLNLWAFIRTWQFVYLTLFFIVQVITLAVKTPPNRAVLYLPLVILFIAYATKLAILIFKHKMKLKQFLKMQLDFISPYVVMLIQIIFASYAVRSLNSISSLSQTDGFHLVEFGTGYMLFSIVATMICSLIMNKKTTKFQLFMILCIIIMETISSLNSSINLIEGLNNLNDQFNEYKTIAILKSLSGKITPEQYASASTMINEIISATENTKDYLLASVGTHIAQLTIMIDLIFRPHEKLQQQSQIQETLLKKLSNKNKNKQIQLTQDLQKSQRS